MTADLRHAAEALVSNGVRLSCLFGPQHGYRGDTQANMVEWKGFRHETLGIPVHSLYGKSREPDASVLRELDTIIIDLPDAGARPYTYIWTAVLMMRACAGTGTEVIVCDRPNPIGGELVEGPLLEPGLFSFVGLFPLVMRHGMTPGEILTMIDTAGEPACRLEVVRMAGWKRSMYFEETGLPWVLPSPNIPTADTAAVYPGTVMLEGTNISEGRGTTRPFEIIGAPWIEPGPFADALRGFPIEGAALRPCRFTPTWDKYHGEVCGGVQVHVLDRERFRPVRFGAEVIGAAAALYPDRFAWSEPPYEYDFEHPPIDILSGSEKLRKSAGKKTGLAELFRSWDRDEAEFSRRREPFLLY